MKTFKRLFIVLFVAAVALTFTACGSPGADFDGVWKYEGTESWRQDYRWEFQDGGSIAKTWATNDNSTGYDVRWGDDNTFELGSYGGIIEFTAYKYEYEFLDDEKTRLKLTVVSGTDGCSGQTWVKQ
ncbi:MAG: hypothetical protein K5930_08800 [Treponemataceae bacterium]|nr:hypothetical protein [Treponemataceae bacterium]